MSNPFLTHFFGGLSSQLDLLRLGIIEVSLLRTPYLYGLGEKREKESLEDIDSG